ARIDNELDTLKEGAKNFNQNLLKQGFVDAMGQIPHAPPPGSAAAAAVAAAVAPAVAVAPAAASPVISLIQRVEKMQDQLNRTIGRKNDLVKAPLLANNLPAAPAAPAAPAVPVPTTQSVERRHKINFVIQSAQEKLEVAKASRPSPSP
ncbi:MAG: hypothetical protein K0R24_1821, partial [Gammaproteobacteria bacterium]|nr:hypothetical protein [Gammaproteobacteria bacterium]